MAKQKRKKGSKAITTIIHKTPTFSYADYPAFTKRQEKEARAKLEKLPIYQAIYVPTTDFDKKIGKKEVKRRIEEAEKWLSKTFGGYTQVKAVGGWVNQNGKLVKEQVYKVIVYSDRASFKKNQQALLRKLAEWKRKWNQDILSYEYENDLYFIG